MSTINQIQVQGKTYDIDISYSPFSRISVVDSSNYVLLGMEESCVLYPITPTSSISFKLSSQGPWASTAAGTVIQNTSYEVRIKTGTGGSIERNYNVGNFYCCYYGTLSYTYSETTQQKGEGINTYPLTVTLYTSVSCLACFLKASV